MDDLMIVSSLDQNLPMELRDFLEEVNEKIQESIRQKNPYIALNVCKRFKLAAQLSGLGLARALYAIKKNWDKYETEEKFEDVAFQYVGVHRHTVDRYVSIWNMFDSGQVPEELAGDLQQRNIKDLVPIAKALEQGYDLTEDDWENLAEAPDYSTISKIIREDVKDKEPRKGSLQIMMNDIGTMWVWSDGERFDLGSLRLLDSTEAVQKAISRIVSNAGVIRK